MRILFIMCGMLLSFQTVYASDNEGCGAEEGRARSLPAVHLLDSSDSDPNSDSYVSSDSDSESYADQLARCNTIEGLEDMYRNTKVDMEAADLKFLEMFGFPIVNSNNEVVPANLPIDQRFFAALPFMGFAAFKIKPQLTYQDLLKIVQSNGLCTTGSGKQMAIVFPNPDEGKLCYALTDCRPLQDLSEDMSAYCTIYGAFSEIFSATCHVAMGELGSSDEEIGDAVEEVATALCGAMNAPKIKQLADIKMVTGVVREEEEKRVQVSGQTTVMAFYPIYRLYKGDVPVKLFALVTFRTDAPDRRAAISSEVSELLKDVAQGMREVDEDKMPDFKTYMNQ
jgi:hypothetical protein